MRYANNEVNESFAQLFIAEATSMLKPLNSQLTNANYDLFIHVLVAAVSNKRKKESDF